MKSALAILALMAVAQVATAEVHYNCFKFEITAVRDPSNQAWCSGGCLQVSEFYFFDTDGVQKSPSSAINPGGQSPSGEDAPKIEDESTNTKWLDHNQLPIYMCFDGLDKDLISYQWNTANDFSNRDPVQWKLYGTSQSTLDSAALSGADWTLISDKSNSDNNVPTARFSPTPLYYIELPKTEVATWQTYQGSDSHAFADLEVCADCSMDECKAKCIENDDCNGFEYFSNEQEGAAFGCYFRSQSVSTLTKDKYPCSNTAHSCSLYVYTMGDDDESLSPDAAAVATSMSAGPVVYMGYVVGAVAVVALVTMYIKGRKSTSYSELSDNDAAKVPANVVV